jgi:precorrin-2 dehydrogenase/sirohydrochlorin ferrochelatase
MRVAPVSARALHAPFAVNLDIAGRRALVVGAGPIAARKAAALLRAGAVVTVVAPDAVSEIAEDPDIRWHRREYRRGEVASYRIAITATDDPTVNAQVARDGEAANVFVNSADDPANCSFILPAVVARGDLQVAISTNGRSPALAKWLRHRLERQITDVHAVLLDVLSDVRDEARHAFGTTEVDGWDDAIDNELLDLVDAGRTDEARDRVRRAIGLGIPTDREEVS